MKSTMTAIWLMVVALGNIITAIVNNQIAAGGWWAKNLKGANYEWFFVLFIMAFVVVFMFVSPHMKEHNYIENPEADKNQIIADTDNL